MTSEPGAQQTPPRIAQRLALATDSLQHPLSVCDELLEMHALASRTNASANSASSSDGTAGQRLAALAQDTARQEVCFADFLEKALKREIAAGDEFRLTAMTKLATTPAIKTLKQFDWSRARRTPEAQMQEPAHLAFVQRAKNVVLLGPSGVGTTHMALALAHCALIAEHKARFGGGRPDVATGVCEGLGPA